MSARSLAILLDLDGTVVDSAPGIVASARAALGALGHDGAHLDIAPLIGPPLEEVMGQVLGRLGDDRVAEAVAAYREHYGAAGWRETTLYPGLREALDDLRAAGATLFIATSKRTVFARRILDGLDLSERFAGIHGSEPGGALDHKADLIADLLRRHDLDASGCVMVGDRRHDIEGARANGLAGVGVLWGYGAREELEAAGAARIIAGPAELIGALRAVRA